MTSPVYFNFGLPVSLQMAIDQVLFDEFQADSPEQSKAVLRFYSMDEPSVTIGYFSRRKNADLLNELSKQYAVVRRATGGGVVFHGSDLVFSLVIKRDASGELDSTAKSYHWVHSILQKAFKKLNVKTGLAAGAVTENSEEVSRNLCFETPVAGDLMAHGRKVAGGAQKRVQGKILHQGSINAANAGLEGIDKKKLAEHIINSFEEALKEKTEVRELDADVMLEAEGLSKTLYKEMESFELDEVV